MMDRGWDRHSWQQRWRYLRAEWRFYGLRGVVSNFRGWWGS